MTTEQMKLLIEALYKHLPELEEGDSSKTKKEKQDLSDDGHR